MLKSLHRLMSLKLLTVNKQGIRGISLRPEIPGILQETMNKLIANKDENNLHISAISEILKNKEVLIADELSNGHRLSYALPLLYKLFQEEKTEREQNSYIYTEHEGPEEADVYFQSSDIIFEKYKQIMDRKLRKSMDSEERGKDFISAPRGALILAPTKDILNQVYVLLRALEREFPLNMKYSPLKINRVGCSGQLDTPIVELMTKENDRKLTNYTEEEKDELMVTNVINNAGCRHTDIWLCTPGLIWFLCEQYEGYHPFEINPQLIVIEQADMMLTQSPFAETTLKIIRKYMDKAHPLFAQINKLRQIVLSCSTFPKMIQGKSALLQLEEWFPNLVHLKSENLHRINPKLKLNFIDVQTTYMPEQLDNLLSLIKDDLISNPTSKIIIFAKNKFSCTNINQFLQHNKLKSAIYNNEIASSERTHNKIKFDRLELNILITTNTSSRGINFGYPIHVIQFDFAEKTIDFIHRSSIAAPYLKYSKSQIIYITQHNIQ